MKMEWKKHCTAREPSNRKGWEENEERSDVCRHDGGKGLRGQSLDGITKVRALRTKPPRDGTLQDPAVVKFRGI